MPCARCDQSSRSTWRFCPCPSPGLPDGAGKRWSVYRTRFGLRLRAVGENAGAGRCRRYLGDRGCATAPC
jgi:hypothetical protein